MTAASSAGPQIDDVGFVAAMIDAIGRERPLDPRRIYATGMSNGAIFSHYVGARLSARIAGIAAVAGGTADPFHRTFRPEHISIWRLIVVALGGLCSRLPPPRSWSLATMRCGGALSNRPACCLRVNFSPACRVPGRGLERGPVVQRDFAETSTHARV